MTDKRGKRSRIISTLAAGAVLASLITAAAVIPFAGRDAGSQAVWLRARMAETGGWTPGSLSAQVGEPLRLKLTSDDVMHSFAIGHSDLPPVDVIPGEVTEITLSFDRPGKYTYYCTRWCGVNHWRMRGTIEVVGPQLEVPASKPPLYVTLGIDIDRPHPAAATPQAPPSAELGRIVLEERAGSVPDKYTTQAYYRSTSPADIWSDLRAVESLSSFSDQQIWDLAAALIQAQTTPEMLADGRQLYAQNCAACHGETGRGDGVMANALSKGRGSDPESGARAMPDMSQAFGQSTLPPVDFSDLNSMLGASPALLQGKIVRGGMGTGMPYWGPILTSEQTWALVAYIQSINIELENKP